MTLQPPKKSQAQHSSLFGTASASYFQLTMKPTGERNAENDNTCIGCNKKWDRLWRVYCHFLDRLEALEAYPTLIERYCLKDPVFGFWIYDAALLTMGLGLERLTKMTSNLLAAWPVRELLALARKLCKIWKSLKV